MVFVREVAALCGPCREGKDSYDSYEAVALPLSYRGASERGSQARGFYGSLPLSILAPTPFRGDRRYGTRARGESGVAYIRRAITGPPRFR